MEKYVLELFLAGTDRDSAETFRRVREMCERYLPGRYRLWVINAQLDPSRAREVTRMPLLRRVQPGPEREYAGDLTDAAAVFRALEIPWPQG